MAIIRDRTIENWFKHDVSFSLELIKGFISAIESQAQELISRYEVGKKVHIEEYRDGDADFIEVFNGLDSTTWDLKSIFSEYFPTLQRRSALITLYGFFEHELDKLCFLIQKQKEFQLSISDITGRGIERSTRYLEKVALLDTKKSTEVWNEIKNINLIRNLIVHQDGKLANKAGKIDSSVTNYIRNTSSLAGDSEIIIKAGYLSHVLESFEKYFKLLAESIGNNYGG